MNIPFINSSQDWHARALIIKPMKNKPDIQVMRGRRVDERDEKDDLVARHSKFELEDGSHTEPIPYNQIYNTQDGPLVLLVSPEKDTYIPAEIDIGGQTLQDVKNCSDCSLDNNQRCSEHEGLTAKTFLEQAMDNQAWLRWGKQKIMDMKLSWEPEESWLKKNAATLMLFIAVILLISVTIMVWLQIGDLSDILNQFLEETTGTSASALLLTQYRR